MVARRSHHRGRTASARRRARDRDRRRGDAARFASIAADPHTRFVTPAWRPDGAAIVAAAAPDDETFNLFEFAADGSSARQLTHTTGGATWPDVSPDGQTIVFVGYTTDGDDLFAMPYPSESPDPVHGFQAPRAVVAPGGATESNAAAAPETAARPAARAYNPLDTLRPTSWTPVVETDGDQVRVGAGVAGVDVLGYHAYAADRDLARLEPRLARRRPSPATPDWQVYYLYDRWRPTFYVAASSDTSFFAGPATDAGTPTQATRRERQLEGGVIVPDPPYARSACGPRRRSCARSPTTRWATAPSRASARRSAQRGRPIRALVRLLDQPRGRHRPSASRRKWSRRALGSFADATTTTADVRAYLPGLAPHHVLALRARRRRLDTETPRSAARSCSAAHSPGTGVVDLDSGAFSLLRGFGADTLRRQPRRRGERRIPLADRATAARPRHVAAVPAHGARGDLRRRRPRLDARVRPPRDQVVGRRATLRGSRRRILRAVHRERRRGVGTRRQSITSPMASPPTSASARRSRYDLIVSA